MKIYRRNGTLISNDQMKELILIYINNNWVFNRDPRMAGSPSETICDLLLSGI